MTEVFIAGTAPTEVCRQHESWYWDQDPDAPPPDELPPQEEEESRPPGN